MENVNPKQFEQLMKYLAIDEANKGMSQTDGSYRREAIPDAPGVYISAEQIAQDMFQNKMIQQQVAAQELSGMRGYQPVQPIISPNTTYIDGSGRVTAPNVSDYNQAQ